MTDDDPSRTVPRPPGASEQTTDHVSTADTGSRAAAGADQPDAGTPPVNTVPRTPEDVARLEEGARDRAADAVAGYATLGELGRGGMGVVYKARHLKLNRLVALKMMLDGAQANRGELIRFLAEAEAVAAVRHPNVVQVYDYGEADGRAFMALEYCPGGTLADRAGDSATAPREAARLLERVARGVAAAHALGIVHRDLKPGNVFLDAAGVPKVADFGLAKWGDGGQATRTGQVMGTPAYMSPEQAKGETKFVGPQADVWALGVMLYEAMTGRRPFQGTVQEILAKVQFADPPSPRELALAVPSDLELICFKCLSKAPHERYPTAQELADDLDRFARGEPISVRPAGALERGYKWVRRKPVLAALYAAVVASAFFLTLGGVFAWIASDARRAEREREAEKNRAEAEEGKARDAEQAAVVQKGIAEQKSEEAATAAQAARTAEQQARAAEQQAKQAKQAEALARAEADEAAYRFRMDRANAAWQQNRVHRALTLLSDTKPEHRDFEWRYVAKLCQSDLRTIRPGGRVGLAGLSPDGRIAYLPCITDKTVRGYDVTTGKETVVYRGHRAGGWAVAAFPDGKRAVSTAEDGSVDVWNVATGERIRRLFDPTGRGAWRFAFAADGKRFAMTRSEFVTVWDAETLEKVCDVKVATGAYSVAFHPHGWLVTGGGDGRVHAWNALTGKKLGATGLHRAAPVNAVGVTADGSAIWSADASGQILRWSGDDLTPAPNPASNPSAVPPAHDGMVWAITFTPDGRYAATASLDQTAVVWDARTLQKLRTFRGHFEDVTSVSFRPGLAQVVTSGDVTLRLWDGTRDAEARVLTPAGPRQPIMAVAVSPDGKHVAASGGAGVCVWEAATGRPVPGWPAFAVVSPFTVAFSPDGKSVAGAARGSVWLRPLAGGSLTSWELGGGDITKVAFDPTGERLAVAHNHGPSRVIDVATGKEVWASRKGLLRPTIAFSPDGKYVATVEGALSNEICLRDAATGEPVRTLTGHTELVLALAFSPDSTRLASGSSDNMTAVWDVATGRQDWTKRDHDHFILGVAFSPNGKRLVDASGDKTVRLRDARSGEEALTLRGHTGDVACVAFSPAGDYLVTCGGDGTVRLWSAPLDVRAEVPKEANQPHVRN